MLVWGVRSWMLYGRVSVVIEFDDLMSNVMDISK